MPSNYGTFIREKFPEHSPIHETGNPMREMLEEGVGPEFDSIEEEIFNSSDMRFLITATGFYLDLFGERYGIRRYGRNDESYRATLIAVKAASPTVAGIKRSISKILDISEDEVIIIKGVESGCREGSMAADYYEGDPCHFIDNFISSTPGTITIKIPLGSGVEILESIISNLVIASVTVILKEYTI